MLSYLWLLLLGLGIGGVCGLAGVGGGIMMIPALVYLYKMPQHHAVGIALAAMVPPVTLAAAAEYYRRGQSNITMALILAVTIALGSWVSAHFADHIPELWLRRIFGAVLFLVSLRFLLFQK